MPIDTHKLRRVDAAIFDGDKFAFEMVHFVKSFRDEGNNSLTAVWDSNFTKGLETLLVECAVVQDEIERNCFVSRVYCWFSEKLTERRDLPRKVMGRSEMKELRSSLSSMGIDATHTMKGLDNMGNSAQLMSKTPADALAEPPSPEKEPQDIPAIQMPTEMRTKDFGNRKLPQYVKHAYPNINMGSGSQYTGFLPKVPGAEDNYGMMYHQPETEGEKQMHELWLARRQQEAFNWKSQQHMNLVMDRLALHKARLESDTLRRQESNAFLRGRSAGSNGNVQSRPYSAEQINNSRYSGQTLRPGSKEGMRKATSMRNFAYAPDSPEGSPQGKTTSSFSNSMSIPITLNNLGLEETAEVPIPVRSGAEKKMKKEPKEIKHIPMRYKIDAPEQFNQKYNTGQFYMQLSDSDDDDKPAHELRGGVEKKTAGKGGKKGGKKDAKAGNAAVSYKFKREVPIVRERPVSAAKFRDVATNDTELKVHYRHTNYRRMPLTEQHEQWLVEREGAREKKTMQLTQTLIEAVEAKSGKGGKGGKDDKKDTKKDPKKDKKKIAEELVTVIPCKYKSAAHAMQVNFPNFEPEDDNDAQGPMRMMQLVECARIIGSMNDYGMEGAVTEETLRKALLIPQDKPEAVSLESMRQTQTEGLMENPIPKEFWRQVSFKAGSGKKGGKKKK